MLNAKLPARGTEPATSQLDPEAQDLLDAMRATGLAPLHTLSVEEARARMRAALIPKGPPQGVANVEDVSLRSLDGPLRLRIYRPASGRLPVALFFHGGGWTLNDVDTHDALCRRLASRSGWMFAALDYRRAPEHRHPAALHDAYFGYRWLLDNAGQIGCDPTCVAVVGESSGGTIAAALTLLLSNIGAPMPTYQVLAYPLVDQFDRWPSYADRGQGYTLDRHLISWFFGHYLPETYDSLDPYLFPIAARNLAGLPPALVMTAEFDPLRDEGVAYAQKLVQAGIPVEHRHVDDQMHGFLMLSRVVRRARELTDDVADALALHRLQSQDQAQCRRE